MSEENNLSINYDITSSHSKMIMCGSTNIEILNIQNKDEKYVFHDKNMIGDFMDGVGENKENYNILAKKEIDEFYDLYSNDLSVETINQIEKHKEKLKQIRTSNFPIGVKIRLIESVR